MYRGYVLAAAAPGKSPNLGPLAVCQHINSPFLIPTEHTKWQTTKPVLTQNSDMDPLLHTLFWDRKPHVKAHVCIHNSNNKKKRNRKYTTFLFIVFCPICPIHELNIRHIIPLLKLKYQAEIIDHSEHLFLVILTIQYIVYITLKYFRFV